MSLLLLLDSGTRVEDDFSLDAVILKTTATSFDLNAILHKEQTGSLALEAVVSDATIIGGSFGLDASILAFGQHDRTQMHFGTQPDTTIYTLEPLGPLPIGTTLDQALAWLYARVLDLDQYPLFGLFSFIQPYFGLDAVIRDAVADNFGLDAWLNEGLVASFGLDATIRITRKHTFGVGAYITPAMEPWNLVRTPIVGAVWYAASAESGSTPSQRAPQAANGIVVYDTAGDAWRKGSAGAIGDWWQVTWDFPHTIDRVRIYDGSYETGNPSSTRRFGNSGTILFSDGSSVPYSGLNDTFLTLDFPARQVYWFRVISGVAGGSNCGLTEVEAYNTTQWED